MGVDGEGGGEGVFGRVGEGGGEDGAGGGGEEERVEEGEEGGGGEGEGGAAAGVGGGGVGEGGELGAGEVVAVLCGGGYLGLEVGGDEGGGVPWGPSRRFRSRGRR